MKKVFVGMSGGVDSSVAVYLLKEKSYKVIGVTFKLFTDGSRCCSKKDVEDARSIATKLNIPFYVFDFEKEFKKYVIKYFISEYISGRTPNPCIRCNEKIKFNIFLNKALELDADYIATGHYANISYSKTTNRFNLKKAKDDLKDQTYFLYRLNQNQLSKTLFPLSEYKKSDIKQIAENLGFKTAYKKESQEICFIPEGKYSSYIQNNLSLKNQEGIIVDVNGKKIGTHNGIYNYTIGQRRGLNIGGTPEPLYVINIVPEKNIIVAGPKKDTFKDYCYVEKLNFIEIPDLKEKITADVMIRYRHKPVVSDIIPVDYDKVKVIFNTPQSSVTSGQSAVFYNKNSVIGGGIII